MSFYNNEVAAMHYRKERERRAKADTKGQIWTYGDGCAMVVQLLVICYFDLLREFPKKK